MYESGRYITKSENRTVTSSTTDGNSFEGVPLNWADVPLVGREKEEQTIRNVLCKNRQKQAKSEAIFIHGSSGTGKSSLVRAVLLSEQEKGQEFWVSGKYAQSDGLSRPFSAVIDAATELCHTVRDSSESVSIRNNIRSNLTDDELQILCAVVPMIGFLLPNSTDQINPTYGVVNESTLIRFMSLFRAFLAAICSPSHPIVLFLDDLQWADDASRKLLSSFFMDLDLENFLFIGIVRDGEETTFDPPADTLIPCHQLVCGSLIESNVNKIVAVATGLKEEETKQLGWIVFRRTYGNPFFVKQFLESLHREELISYNAKDERFDWDVDIIAKRMSPSSNVVDLLVDEISSLPRDSQLVLVIASTLGYTFDASVLETILESVDLMSLFPRKLLLDEENAAADPVEAPLLQSHDAFCNVNLQKSLRKASKAGLIQQIYPGKYKFTHDRVQQSATRLLPGGRRGERIKSNLGLLVLELSRSNKSEDWMLFTATNLLLENSIDIDNDKVAKLCLEAAKKASLQAAFKSSATYADSGLKKLGSSGWKSNYELCLDLCSLSAEMHYSNGNLKSTKKRVKIIEKKASKAEDRFRAYNVLIDMLFSEDDFSGCIEEGQRGMEYLGVKTPKNPGLLNVASNLLKCKRLLAGRKASDLSSLPTMDNATVEEVLRLMSTTAMASWHNGDNNHCVVLCLIMFQTTLKHGISVHAPYALVAYAVCLSHLGEMKEAVEYGTAALQLLKLPEMEPAVAKTLVVVHSFLWHLKFPMRESSAELTKAYEVGVKAADSLQSCMALRVAGALGIFVGAKSLPEHESVVQKFCVTLREYKQSGVLKMLLPWAQLIENLRGNAELSTVLRGTFADETAIVEQFNSSSANEVNHRHAALATHYARMVLLYLCGEHQLAELDRKKYSKVEGEMSTYVQKLFHFVFAALNCFALARESSKKAHISKAKKYMSLAKPYVKEGSTSVLALMALLEAELLAAHKKYSPANDQYKRAMKMLKREDFQLLHGIAMERAALCLFDSGKKKDGEVYLKRSWRKFEEYGAKVKLEQMEKLHGSMVHL